MRKGKKAVVSLFMALAVFCFGLFVLPAKDAPSSARASEENPKIAVSVPASEEYNTILHIIGQSYPGYDIDVYEVENTQDQIEGLDLIIPQDYDMIMIQPLDINALLPAALEISYAGIGLVVISEYVAGFPDGTIFLDIDTYYDMGVDHADWVLENYAMTEDLVVYIYYHQANNGTSYKTGISDRLQERNFSGTVVTIGVDTDQNLNAALNDFFNGNDEAGGAIEHVTHSDVLAESILRRYCQEGYREAESGTGIRAFGEDNDEADGGGNGEGSGGQEGEEGEGNGNDSSFNGLEETLDAEYEQYLEGITEMIADIITYYMAGEEIPDSQTIDGCYVVSCGFGPGYVKYVSK